MSLPKKGRRPISVDGQPYCWRIRRAPTYTQGAFEGSMTLAVQHASDDSQSVLVADLVISRPDNWIAPHQTSVTPQMVRDIIRAAVAAGWDPWSKGPFSLRHPISKRNT